MSERDRTAHYRRCMLTDGAGADNSGGETLQSLLVAASTSTRRPWLRAIGPARSAHQLLTQIQTKNTCLCGELVFYEAGRMIPLVDVEKDGTTWQDTIAPKDTKGKSRNLQEHSLCFAIRENHVAILQTVLLQADDLRDFLAWLIQSQSNLKTDSLIDLQNLPAKTALNKLKDHSIRGVKFGEKLFTKVQEEVPSEDMIGTAPSGRNRRKKFVQRLETSPRLLKVLLGLGVDQPILEKLSKNPDPGSIQVDIEISYRSRSEKDAVSILHAVAGTLGNQPGLDTEITLSGNTVIRGDELSIRGPISIQCPHGCYSVDDALTKLSRWLVEKIKSGTLA